MTAPPVDAAQLWLPLLRLLTETSSQWGIWKNVDSALAGHGDIDSAAPADQWDLVTNEFHRWSAAHGLAPAVACHHVSGVLFLVAPDWPNGTLVELDVNARKYFRGSTLFRAEDLAGLMEIDDRGFRRVRRGAEALILLCQNGMRWGGRPNSEGLRARRVAELLRSDPEGVRAAAELFGPAAGAMTRVAEGLISGEWDRRAAVRAELLTVVRGLGEPAVIASRARARHVKKRCPVLVSIFAHDRRLPSDPGAWWAEVRQSHATYGGASRPRGMMNR